MDEKRYEYRRGKDVFNYEFESEGPKGSIVKKVRFDLMTEFPFLVYNIAFGDWNVKQEKLDDSVTTNNADKREVLATVADVILKFIHVHPDAFIYAEGSTPSRTRLYQMAISSFYADISKLLTIKGQIKKQWQLFRKGVNYEAFLAKKRK
ncbi:MAG: hypothetical protein E6Q24_01755 [Chitinophagaceae bacterium]|jgi:hypothetical protein|nr:MAG: hypothetical protein E6Q24_01755 [Chitinophagaceae bacterium]